MRCNNRVSCRSRRLKCPYDFYKYNIAVFRTNKKMDKIIVFVIFIYYASENVSATAADPLVSKYGNLVFSTLIYRHGDRSIERTYSSDPYANKYYWPMGFGQLTPVGIERHFELGKWLRKRYAEWLPEVYSAEDVYVRSSDYDRTIISAQANLDGMYPPVETKRQNQTLLRNTIQLIPIHTVPISEDNILAMSSNACPMYSLDYSKLGDDFEIRRFYKRFSSVFQLIRNNTDLETEKQSAIKSSSLLYDVLLVESQFNYTLPEWTKSIFPEPLMTIATESYGLSAYTNVLKRLKAGPLLNDLVNRMSEKKNGTLNPDRMLWIYSAHDFTIINLLNAMNLYEHTLVPYAAVLMIELRLNVTGNYVVTISYRNETEREPYSLRVPGCDAVACDLDSFIDGLRPILPVDWHAECKINGKNDFWELSNYLFGIFIIAVVVMSMSYAFADKILCCFRRRTDYYQTF